LLVISVGEGSSLSWIESFFGPTGSGYGYRVLNKLADSLPGLVWHSLERKWSSRGFDRLCVVLSYDCDRSEDAPASEVLFRRLQTSRIQANFAVPGVQLEAFAGLYRKIAEQGGLFLNHGYRPHAEWNGRQYVSVNSYANVSPEEIREDILRGHDAVLAVTGQKPVGFRAPHFGHFQQAAQLDFLHQVLNQMGYLFSSSTVPLFALIKPSPWKVRDLYEIPVSGSYGCPLTVFDSWTYARPGLRRVGASYGKILQTTVERLLQRRFCGYLNFYADPSHVHDSKEYHQAIDFIVQAGVPIISFTELVQMLAR
jgi:hypothetical protein